MPTSFFVMAQKEWECGGCGEAILRGHRYWRQRLRPVCLGCHTSGEGVQGPILRIVQTLDHKSRCQVNGDNKSKKGSRVTEPDKSTLYSASFLYRGDEIGGKFIPMEVCIQADTLDAQEAVQAFLEQYGLKGDLNRT